MAHGDLLYVPCQPISPLHARVGGRVKVWVRNRRILSSSVGMCMNAKLRIRFEDNLLLSSNVFHCLSWVLRCDGANIIKGTRCLGSVKLVFEKRSVGPLTLVIKCMSKKML